MEQNAVEILVGRGTADAKLRLALAKSTVRTMGGQVGRSLIRGLRGSLFGGR